jgi:hypothetical protein
LSIASATVLDQFSDKLQLNIFQSRFTISSEALAYLKPSVRGGEDLKPLPHAIETGRGKRAAQGRINVRPPKVLDASAVYGLETALFAPQGPGKGPRGARALT